MEDTQPVASLMDSTSSKIQQLQKAFAELESHRAVTLNLKWKELEEHFHGLEKSLKRSFHELEDQEKEFSTRTMTARNMLEKRTAAIVAKEQASLERLQEKRDAAVFSIATAREKYRKVSENPDAIVDEGQRSSAIVEQKQQCMEDKPPDTMTTESNLEEAKDLEDEFVEVKSYPQLLSLCKEMDAQGLHKFISDNRKNLSVIREEIPFALKATANPASFVLDCLEDFYRAEVTGMDGKMDSSLLGIRRTCIMLMECLSMLLMNLGLVFVSEIITDEVTKRAEAIAEDWKPKLDALDMDASSGNSLEAHAFLQLLASFDIASGFDEEDLSKLIPMVSRRRQTADLCRSLGLSKKMPGVIEVLVNSGRHIDAVNLAYAFELTELFSPVVLLKSYLKEARKTYSPVKPGNSSPTAQNEVNERELSALKTVIKCIEEHKMEEQYPLDPLQKRFFQLEKAKADKKRVTEAAKPQPKRPRANGIHHGSRVTNIAADKTYYPRVADNRYQQFMFERPVMYPGPPDNHCASMLGSATYNMSPAPAHGNYFTNAYQYQTSYLH